MSSPVGACPSRWGRVLTPGSLQAAASVVSGVPPVLLSSLTTEAVCERVRLVEGIDHGMLPQYTATIRKVGGPTRTGTTGTAGTGTRTTGAPGLSQRSSDPEPALH